MTPLKALFIVTRTNEMHKHYESWACLGHEFETYTYTHPKGGNWPSGGKLDDEIIAAATNYKPDAIVYVGACKSNTPSVDCFKRLRKDIAPTVHLCSDAEDEPWWDELKLYDKEGCFSVQVSLDGSSSWPLKETQLTELTPIDPAHYPIPPKPHKDRTITFGFAGNPGSISKLKDGRVTGRRPLVAEMIQFGLKHRPRDHESIKGTYQKCADYIADTRIMPNFPLTGSYERMHVKGRVVEVGLAGGCLLEMKGSPTPNFFEPGVDYLEWETTEEARQIVERLKDNPDETQAFGMRLWEKVKANHGPDKFWGRILHRCGLNGAS